MFEVGRLIVKFAGRDAGKYGLIVEVLDDNFVLIDGQVRRRKCNIIHIEPLKDVVKIKKGASSDEVIKALKSLKIEARKTKPKPKTERPRKLRKKDKVASEKVEGKKKPKLVKKKEESVELNEKVDESESKKLVKEENKVEKAEEKSKTE